MAKMKFFVVFSRIIVPAVFVFSLLSCEPRIVSDLPTDISMYCTFPETYNKYVLMKVKSDTDIEVWMTYSNSTQINENRTFYAVQPYFSWRTGEYQYVVVSNYNSSYSSDEWVLRKKGSKYFTQAFRINNLKYLSNIEYDSTNHIICWDAIDFAKSYEIINSFSDSVVATTSECFYSTSEFTSGQSYYVRAIVNSNVKEYKVGITDAFQYSGN